MSKKHRIALIALCVLPVFIKSVPAVGVRPWACACADVLCMCMIVYTAGKDALTAYTASFFVQLAGVLQGSINILPAVCCFIGYALCTATVRRKHRTDLVTAAACGGAEIYAMRTVGFAAEYIARREIPAYTALWRVARNSWFILVIYVAGLALFALIYGKRKHVGAETER